MSILFLFSIPLNGDIVDIEKADEKCSSTFVADVLPGLLFYQSIFLLNTQDI